MLTAGQAWLCCFFLGNVTLGRTPAVDGDDDGARDVVVEEPYLWSLLRGRRRFGDGETGIRLERARGGSKAAADRVSRPE